MISKNEILQFHIAIKILKTLTYIISFITNWIAFSLKINKLLNVNFERSCVNERQCLLCME